VILRTVPPRPRIEGRVWLRQGRTIGFAEYGQACGAPVLWFHGTPGGRHQVPPAACAAACARGIRLIGVERPGIGASTAYRHASLLGWADDVEELANRLAIERFALIGLSGGGPYVLACAYRLPQRVVAGAVLGGIAPACGDEAPAGGLIARVMPFAPVLEVARQPLGALLWGLVRALGPLSSQVFDRFIELMPDGDQRMFRRPEVKAMFIDDLTRASRTQMLAPVDDILQFTRPWGFSLRDIRVPIRFWHGDADNIVPLAHAEHMAALVPDAALRVRPGEGHIGNLGAAEEILDVILSLWPAGANPVDEAGRRTGPAPAS
jgi:pimeloyl-ACP methyl ester carboxylesterase